MKETSEIINDLLAKEQELTQKVKMLKDAESELAMVQGALKALAVTSQKHINSTPASYNPKATWKEKIKYTAIVKGEAGIKEITEYISKMEPSLNYQTIYNSVAVNVGEMVKKQKTLGSKDGDGKKVYFYIGK